MNLDDQVLFGCSNSQDMGDIAKPRESSERHEMTITPLNQDEYKSVFCPESQCRSKPISKGPSTLDSMKTASLQEMIMTAPHGADSSIYAVACGEIAASRAHSPDTAASIAATAALLNVSPGSSSRRLRLGCDSTDAPAGAEGKSFEWRGKFEDMVPPTFDEQAASPPRLFPSTTSPTDFAAGSI